MTVTLKSGQLAHLVQVSGAFAVIRLLGHQQVTIVDRSFIHEPHAAGTSHHRQHQTKVAG